MKISILCVGKIKEKFYKDAITEYTKRLSRYASVNVVEVEDEKTPDGASDTECDNIKKKEAERILKAIDKCGQGSYVITLEIEGKNLSSEEMADKIQKLGVDGVSHIVFVIGGSLGLHDSITRKADMHLSFSRMTFPHQLMRVILLEQIYRSFRIISGEPYHK
jgi:rRNA large subunit m3Psi methyltransferase RlmH